MLWWKCEPTSQPKGRGWKPSTCRCMVCISELAAEAQEGRPMTKGNPEQSPVTRTQGRGQALSGLDRVREAASQLAFLRQIPEVGAV